MISEAVLLVAHGAHDPGNEGNREVERVAGTWRERHPEIEIHVCWIEHAPVLLETGLESAAATFGESSGRLLDILHRPKFEWNKPWVSSQAFAHRG